jgi:hypothetical protein
MREARGHSHGKSDCAARIVRFGSINLVHASPRQPTAQSKIHRTHAKLPVGLHGHL